MNELFNISTAQVEATSRKEWLKNRRTAKASITISGGSAMPGASSSGTPSAPSATHLGELSDVTLTEPKQNDVLKYDGNEWVNSPLSDAIGGSYYTKEEIDNPFYGYVKRSEGGIIHEPIDVRGENSQVIVRSNYNDEYALAEVVGAKASEGVMGCLRWSPSQTDLTGAGDLHYNGERVLNEEDSRDFLRSSGDSMNGPLEVQAPDAQITIVGAQNDAGDYRAQIIAESTGERYGGISWSRNFTDIQGASGHLTYNDEPLVSILDLSDTPVFTTVDNEQKIVQLQDRGFRSVAYPITRPEAVVDEEGRNILEVIDASIKGSLAEDNLMYGVEWDVTVADPAMTRIGNMALHRQLPIQSRMKGCLLDDNGNVVEYLNPATWEDAVRDGSKGQVMVEIPEHYRKFETEGNIRRAKISEYPLLGYHYVPKMYISAYEASVQRSTGKLASVRNTTADYRGGNNSHSAWDSLNKTMLGRPATQMTREEYRNAARKRGSTSWNMLDYNAHKAMCWLYLIEYASRNSQLPVMPKDANGFMQGGLGEGVNIGESWSSYNSWWPVVPCGHTDCLGNHSGEVAYEMLNDDGSVFKTVYVPRYRGIENVFGHIWKASDGINTVMSEGVATAYVADAPSLYTDSGVDGYVMIGNAQVGDSFFRDIIFGDGGDIISSIGDGGNSEYWCDYAFTNVSDGVSAEMFGGNARYGGATAGLFSPMRRTPYAVREEYNGTRLCYIPPKL